MKITGWRAVIGNDASYVRYVHDSKEQARFHKRRGWVTDRTAIRESREDIMIFLKFQADRLLEGK
jgi:hypothetical protein